MDGALQSVFVGRCKEDYYDFWHCWLSGSFNVAERQEIVEFTSSLIVTNTELCDGKFMDFEVLFEFFKNHKERTKSDKVKDDANRKVSRNTSGTPGGLSAETSTPAHEPQEHLPWKGSDWAECGEIRRFFPDRDSS